MFKATLCCLLALGLACLTAPRVYGQAATAEKARQTIREIGEGYTSRAAVELWDGTKLEGYVSTIAVDYFAITSEKTGKTTRVSYGDVKQVTRRKPRRWSNRRPIGAILAAIGIVVGVFVLYGVADRKG